MNLADLNLKKTKSGFLVTEEINAPHRKFYLIEQPLPADDGAAFVARGILFSDLQSRVDGAINPKDTLARSYELWEKGYDGQSVRYAIDLYEITWNEDGAMNAKKTEAYYNIEKFEVLKPTGRVSK